MVNSVLQFQKKNEVEVELIIVNDGSRKGVKQVDIDRIQNNISHFKYEVYTQNKGKGYALRQGVSKSNSTYIIYTDIDFPYTAESLQSIYLQLKNGNAIVLGHRGETYYSKTPYIRKLVSKFLRWSLKTFLRLPTDDSQCGIKGFNQDGAAVFLQTKIDRFLFDLEFIKLASKTTLKIKTAEVTLKPNVEFSKVNFKILARESINFLRVLMRK